MWSYSDTGHPPEFYSEVAEKLEEIVKSTKIKTQIPEAKPSPGNHRTPEPGQQNVKSSWERI